MSIEQQIELERDMISRGQNKYATSEKAALEGGREAETTYAKALIKDIIPALAQDLTEYCDVVGKGIQRVGKYRKLLATCDAEKAAYIALRGVFQDTFNHKPMVHMAKNIGRCIEEELKFTRFQEQHEEYYNTIIADFKRKNTTQYRHRKRVLTFKLNEKEVRWNSWSDEERVQVGMILLDRILATSDLIKKIMQRDGRKTVARIVLTQQAVEWIEKHKDHMALLYPECLPTIIEPDQWTDYDHGGYYTPTMRARVPMVKCRAKAQVDLIKRSDMTRVKKAMNSLQSTEWRVNQRVYSVLKDVWRKGLRIGMGANEPIQIPPSPVADINKEAFTEKQQELFMDWKKEAAMLHTAERERVSKNFQVLRIMRIARDYEKYDKFHFVYQADFRGRLYATCAAFSPQGSDMGKGVLEFRAGPRLTARGFFQLKVHFANLCGIDKVDYPIRAEYADARTRDIIECGRDPLGKFKDLWAGTDKPYQTLAAVFELADCFNNGYHTVESRLPVALDGTCNGLQHFAAILRDERGAEATNVVDTGRVADVYSAVGRVAFDKLVDTPSTHPSHALWIRETTKEGQLPRKLSKKPVMTLPYGSTRRSCTDSIAEFIIKEWPTVFPEGERFSAAMYLTPILWSSITDVVQSARLAMDWLQAVGTVTAKANKPLMWYSPVGFPVYQATPKIKTRRIITQLSGECRLTIGGFTKGLDSRKQRSGISPNFVHSYDAAHIMLTINSMADKGVYDFAPVHDSYGVQANHVDELHKAIREEFSWMYADKDILGDFHEQQETENGLDLPLPPTMGNLDVTRVKSAPFFYN